MNKFWSIYKTLFAIILFSGGMVSCHSGEANNISEDTNLLRGELEPTAVYIDTAKHGIYQDKIVSMGRLRSVTEAFIVPQISGIVSEVHAINGRSINKGKLILVVANEKEKLALRKSEIQLQERKSEFESLLMGYSSENLTDTLRNSLRYSSGLAAAELSYLEANLTYQSTFIRAPISGLVSNLDINKGKQIKSGEPICFIYDHRNMQVSCEVTGTQALKLKKGLKVKIEFDSETQVRGYIDQVNPITDEETGLVTVIVRMNDLPDPAIHGMSVKVRIEVPQQEALLVPSKAVVDRSGRNVVFVMEKDQAIWRYVEIGRSNDEMTEILSGLEPGDIVIVSNNVQLGHEAKVVVLHH